MMIMMLIQLMLTLPATGASGNRQKRNLHTGVYKKDGKYQVQIYAGGKRHHLGTYESISEAEEKYKAALAARKGETFPEFLKHHKAQKKGQKKLPKGVYKHRGKYEPQIIGFLMIFNLGVEI